MKEKVKRILDLVRAGKLELEDAAPLLAALHARLALTEADRELLRALLAREDLETGQVAEHLLLLRGVRDTPPAPPPPPRAPGFGRAGLVDRITGGIEEMVENIAGEVDRAVNGSGPRAHYSSTYARTPSSRLLRIEVESQHGDEYSANIPVSLAAHLERLIPGHGLRALEAAGFGVDTLRLLIEADPPPGPLIDAEDQHGNSVRISLK